MCDFFMNLLNTFLGAIIGGGVSILTMAITLKKQHKKDRELQQANFEQEDKIWLRENRLNLYIELVEVLESFEIPIAFDETTPKLIGVDVDVVEGYIEDMRDYINNNKGKLFLFLPNQRYQNIMKLRANLYEIFSTPEYQQIDVEDFKGSKIYDVVIQAKRISLQLRKDLGFSNSNENRKN